MPSASPNAGTAGAAAVVGASAPPGPGWHDRLQELEFLLGDLPGFVYRSRRTDHWYLEYISDGVLAVTGYAVADLIETRTQSTATIMDPADQIWFWPALLPALEAGQPYAFEYRIRTAAGETRWLLDKGKGLYADGRLVGATGFAMDISDRKRMEEALRASRDELAALFESSRDAIFIADAETGLIVDVNPAAVRLMVLPRERLIGMHQAELHPPELAERVRTVFREHVGGILPNADVDVLTGDGRRVPVCIVGSASAQRHGRRVVQGTFHDLTARRQAEREAADLRQLVGVVLANSEMNLAIVAADLSVLYVDPVWRTAHGVPGGRAWREYFAWRGLPWAEEQVRQVLAEQRVVARDYLLPGGERTVNVNIVPFLSAAGEPLVAQFELDVTEPLQAEQARRDSEGRYRRLFELESDAIVLMDVPAGRILDANQAAVALLGYTRAELLTMRSHDLSAEPEATARTIQTQTTRVPLRRARRKDGTVFPAEVTLSYFDDGGRKVCLAAVRDTTVSVAAEGALRESERRYRRLFELESDAIVVVDNETCQILDANQAAERLYGYSRAELLDRRSIDLSAEPESTRQMTRALVQHVPLHYHRRKDGTVFPAEIAGSYFEEGARTIHIAAVRDVSARLAAESALEESARRLDSLLNNLPGCAYRYRNDAQGTVDYVSDGVAALTGYPASDFIDNRVRSFRSVMDPGDAEKVAAELGAAFATRRPYMVEFRIQTAGGDERWLWAKGCGVYEGETLVASEGFATDVTERRRAEAMQKALEAQLAQGQKMELVGRLAGGVAHDFNNLLTVILGCSSMAMDETREPHTLADLHRIHKAGERARGLTRQLLAFGRKQVLDLRRLDLNRVILDYVDMLRRLIGEDVMMQTALQPDLWEASGDAAQMVQVLMNLAANARDAMPGGGSLLLRTANHEAEPADSAAAVPGLGPGRYILLEVTDTGCGMDSETRKHLFEPFFTTKAVGKGVGLGLSTIYGIVVQHGGHIACDSSPGKGTTFRVYLPCPPEGVAAAVAPPTAPDPQPAVGGNEVILLVEDDPTVLRMAASFLARYGYQVVSADSPAAALRLIASLPRLDLLLSDVIMPGMNGRELYTQVATLKPGVRVLYMSGYPGEVLSDRGHLGAGIRLVPKPFTAITLSIRVREALDAPPPTA